MVGIPDRMLTERELEAIRLPRAYWKVALERLPEKHEARRKIVLWLRRLDDALRLGYGFVFHGEYRQGKTSLIAICLKGAIAADRSGLFIRADAIPGIYMEREEHNALESLAQRMVSADVLGIDDLGQEKFKDEGKAMIERVVRARYDRQKAMLISTNSPTVLDKTHDAIARLIRARCESVELRGMHWYEAEKKERGEFFRDIDCKA